MSKSNNNLKYVLIACGALVLLFGLLGFVLPIAEADVIVELVRKTPPDEVYELASQKLAQGARNYHSIFIVLGLVIVVASWADLRRNKFPTT